MKAIWTFAAITLVSVALSMTRQEPRAAEVWLIVSMGSLSLVLSLIISRLMHARPLRWPLGRAKLALSFAAIVVMLPILGIIAVLTAVTAVPAMLVAVTFLPSFLWSERAREEELSSPGTHWWGPRRHA